MLSGSGRFRVADDVFDVGADDIVYCPPDAMRAWEAGPDGMDMLAFGAHTEGEDTDDGPGVLDRLRPRTQSVMAMCPGCAATRASHSRTAG